MIVLIIMKLFKLHKIPFIIFLVLTIIPISSFLIPFDIVNQGILTILFLPIFYLDILFRTIGLDFKDLGFFGSPKLDSLVILSIFYILIIFIIAKIINIFFQGK